MMNKRLSFIAPLVVLAALTSPTAQAEADASYQGRYKAAALGQVQIDLKRYNGELEVAEVLATHGRVSKGQPILRLAAPDLDEQLDKAKESLEKAERGLGWAKDELAMLKADQAVAAQRRGLAWEDAKADQKAWEAFGKIDMYRNAKLGMQQQEARVADEQEELNQLEKLYKDAKLASRTQDIVLGRAQRSLKISKERLEMARRSYEQSRDVLLPREERNVINRMKWMEQDHRHAVARAKVALQRQVDALKAAEQAVEDAQQAVADLQADRKSLVILAPDSGVLSPVTVKKGEKASDNQKIGSMQSGDAGELTLMIKASDLRVISEGDRVAVKWLVFSEIKSTGTVKQIAWQGEAAGEKETSYRVTIELNDVAAVIRPGMLAEVTFGDAAE